MNEFEILVTLLLYLLFFGWIGVRRGTLPELIVLGVALLFWVGIQTFSGPIVTFTNLPSKVLQAVFTGQFSTEDLNAIAALPNVVTPENQRAYLFLLWGLALLLTYILTGSLIDRDALGNPGWAFLVGIANALVFASILLPRLITLVLPEVGGAITLGDGVTLDSITDRVDIFGVLGRGIGVIVENLSELWVAIQPQAELVLLVLLTLILVLAASTLRPPRQRRGGS